MEYKLLVTVSGKYQAKSFGRLVAEGEDFKLFYRLEGDQCVLQSHGNGVLQSRKGNFNTQILFEEGRETLCRIEEGAFRGDIPVFTKKLVRVVNGGDLKIKIYYSMGGEDIVTEITASAVREKK